MEREMEIKLSARLEAGRQALGIVGRSESSGFVEAFEDFKTAYGFLKEEFEATLSTSDVADPEEEPNV